MNDERQFEFDFRTGRVSAICDDRADEEIRSACRAINRRRTRGLLAAAQAVAPGESVSADVWATTYSDAAAEWEVPPVDIEGLGLWHDSEGFLNSEEMVPLTSGAEAQPFCDRDDKVVYKLFDLRPSGALGKKLAFRGRGEGFEVDVADANWLDTIEKINVLNDGGGLPTEIVGLSSTGEFLIVKQPLAYPFQDFEVDREVAEERMRAVIPVGGGLRQRVFVTNIDDLCWIVGDLHERNIMRDREGTPAIIDALVGKITPKARKSLSWLNRACLDAEEFRSSGIRPRDTFGDVSDDDL